jgi:uncharacterized membrane protein YqjE
MPTREAERMGVAPAAKQVAEHASALARLEMELASLELKGKVASLGLGVGLLIGAGFFGLFAVGFGLTTIAVVLAIVLDTWLALLIVFGSLLLLATILALVGLARVRKGTPPVPEQAIQEARLTTEVLKSNGHS